MKYRYQIEGLDCANCANKIETRLKKESDLQDVELNFMLKKLTLTSEQQDEEALRSRIEHIADSIEKGVKVVPLQGKVEGKKISCDRCQCEAEGAACSEHYEKEPVAHSHDNVHSHAHADKHQEETAYKDDKSSEKKEKIERNLLILGLMLFGLGVVVEHTPLGGAFFIRPFISKFLLIAAYICVGYDIVTSAFKNLLRGSMLDENFLMTLATLAAFVIGEYPEAVAVMAFYKIGEAMQNKAVGYSRKEIAKAMDIRPDFARVIQNGEEKILNPEAVHIGDILEVRVGERLPLDGVIVEGTSSLDTSMLTGEAMPVEVKEGSKVLSGSINKEGILKVKVTTSFGESTVSKILELIENATSKKSKSENFITKFARWYTPIVVGLAVFTAIVPSLLTGNWQEWIYSSIIFLVISCPCAVVVSVPLGFFAGLGASAHQGILVKGSNYLEELNTIDTIVLDKTGTITKGEFGLTEVVEVNGSREEILKLAAALEKNSNHPIARSIVKAYNNRLAYDNRFAYDNKLACEQKEPYVLQDEELHEVILREVILHEVKEISGEGMVGSLEGVSVLAGNEKLMARYNIPVNRIDTIGSHIYVAQDGIYMGCIVVADQIKADSKAAIKQLKALGIKKVVMLTGDKKEIAHQVGEEVGVDEVYAELLPQDKVAKVEALLEEGKVAFVGDGINDAPVLARADIGISMGGAGSDAAIEASDIVLMTDELSSISEVLGIARRTRRIVTQNIVFALGVKVIVLGLGIFGIANMWLAIFADVGVSVLAVMNAIRVLGGNFSILQAMMKK